MAEMRMVRMMCGKTLKDKCQSAGVEGKSWSR